LMMARGDDWLTIRFPGVARLKVAFPATTDSPKGLAVTLSAE